MGRKKVDWKWIHASDSKMNLFYLKRQTSVVHVIFIWLWYEIQAWQKWTNDIVRNIIIIIITSMYLKHYAQKKTFKIKIIPSKRWWIFAPVPNGVVSFFLTFIGWKSEFSISILIAVYLRLFRLDFWSDQWWMRSQRYKLQCK